MIRLPLATAVLLLLGASATASAQAPAGHYHPNDIAGASKVFAAAAESVAPRYDAAAQKLQKVGRGLELLELGALTMGSRTPAALSDWMAATRRQATGEYLRLQRHVDLMGEDYSTEFGAALARVLAAEDANLVECGATGIAAMVGGKDCPGEDANARIAAAIDQDEALQAAIRSIDAIEWPAVSEPSRTCSVVPLTGTEQWIQVGALVGALFPTRLQNHQDDLDRSLAKIMEDDSRSREDMLDAAEAERARYGAALAADGEIIFTALQLALEKGAKKGAPASVGLCPNAPSLGGCTGTDVTREVVTFLKADKKFSKATAALQ
jgi:hypothetical protein